MMEFFAGLRVAFAGLQLILGFIDKASYELRVRKIRGIAEKAGEGKLEDRLDAGKDAEDIWNRDT